MALKKPSFAHIFFIFAAMRKKEYKYLFFDLDHTLWDFETNAKGAIRETFTKNELHTKGISCFDTFFDRYTHHNTILWDRYTKGHIKQEELRWRRMFRTLLDFKIGDEELSKSMSDDFLEALPNGTSIFPYTFEILDYLKDKEYQLFLITNGFENTQKRKLVSSGLEKYFDYMITSDSCNSLKPNKEIFEFALSHTKATLEKSIMIGDNLNADIMGAQKIGMDTIFVNHIEADAGSVKPTFTIHHLQELEEIF